MNFKSQKSEPNEFQKPGVGEDRKSTSTATLLFKTSCLFSAQLKQFGLSEKLLVLKTITKNSQRDSSNFHSKYKKTPS